MYRSQMGKGGLHGPEILCHCQLHTQVQGLTELTEVRGQ